MKKPYLLPLIAVLAFVLASSSAFAGSSKPKTKATPPPQHTTISAIDANSITVNEAKATKTFKITNDTEIDFKGQKATVSALQPGMRVSVTTGTDPTVAARISASDAPKEPPAKK